MRKSIIIFIFLIFLNTGVLKVIAEPSGGCYVKPNAERGGCYSCRKCRQFDINCLKMCVDMWSEEVKDALIDCLIIIDSVELVYNVYKGDIIDVINTGLVMVIDKFIPHFRIIGDIIDCAYFGLVSSIASSCMEGCCSGGWTNDECCYNA